MPQPMRRFCGVLSGSGAGAGAGGGASPAADAGAGVSRTMLARSNSSERSERAKTWQLQALHVPTARLFALRV